MSLYYVKNNKGLLAEHTRLPTRRNRKTARTDTRQIGEEFSGKHKKWSNICHVFRSIQAFEPVNAEIVIYLAPSQYTAFSSFLQGYLIKNTAADFSVTASGNKGCAYNQARMPLSFSSNIFSEEKRYPWYYCHIWISLTAKTEPGSPSNFTAMSFVPAGSSYSRLKYLE